MMKGRKGCLITLWIFGTLFLILICLIFRSWKDECTLFVDRVNDTTLIAEISGSAFYLTDLKGKFRADTLVLHSYSKFVYFTLLPSRQKDRRALLLNHPVKYVKYKNNIWSFGDLPVYDSQGHSQFEVENVLPGARVVK